MTEETLSDEIFGEDEDVGLLGDLQVRDVKQKIRNVMSSLLILDIEHSTQERYDRFIYTLFEEEFGPKLLNKPVEVPRKIKIGNVEVKLIGEPFTICVDTFAHEEWFEGYFDTNEKAIKYAEITGKPMLKIHAYDKDGKHIGEGGTV